MASFKLLEGRVTRETLHSAAMDLFYNGKEPWIIGDQPVAVPTGVKTEFDSSMVAIIKEKSGLALKGLEVKGGVIDADYRDEWKVIVRNPMFLWEDPLSEDMNRVPEIDPDWKPFVLEPGMKVAQFILVSLAICDLEGSGIELKEKIREGGFGSTGK